MASSLINMLDDLEARLECTQAELKALREENQRLKQQLALKSAQGQSVPSSETATSEEPEVHNPASLDTEVLDTEVLDTEVLDTEVLDTEALDTGELGEKDPDEAGMNPAALDPPAIDPAAIDSAALDEETSVEKPPSEAVPSKKTNPPTAAETSKAPSPHALLNQWYERYPKAFFKGHTKPLKVGIHQELAEREEWPSKLIRRALANYVNLPRYIKAVREGAERVDLDGQPAGKVDKEAALHAAEKRGDKKENQRTRKGHPKPSASVKKPHEKAVKQTVVEEAVEKSEPYKPLSMEDKLLGLQQKFKGR